MVKLLPTWALSTSMFAVAVAAATTRRLVDTAVDDSASSISFPYTECEAGIGYPIGCLEGTKDSEGRHPRERDSPLLDSPVDVPASPFISTPYNECGKGPDYPIGCPPGTPVIESVSVSPTEPDSPTCGPYPGLPMCLETVPEPTTIDVPAAPSSSDSSQLTPRAKDPIKYSECVSDGIIALHTWRHSCLVTYQDILTPPWCRLTATSPKNCCIDEDMAYTCKLFRPADNPEWREKTCDKAVNCMSRSGLSLLTRLRRRVRRIAESVWIRIGETGLDGWRLDGWEYSSGL